MLALVSSFLPPPLPVHLPVLHQVVLPLPAVLLVVFPQAPPLVVHQVVLPLLADLPALLLPLLPLVLLLSSVILVFLNVH